MAAVGFWTMGSLIKASWPKLGVAAAVLAFVLPLLARHGWALTAIWLGDAKTVSMGVNPRRLRLEVLVLVSLLAAIATAFVGSSPRSSPSRSSCSWFSATRALW